MALSQKQRTKILFYLGHPGLTIVPDSTFFSGIISDRFDAANDVPEICMVVVGLLKKLEDIDCKLEKARCRLSASKVDSITLNEKEISKLLCERTRCIKELSAHIAIPYKGLSRVVGVVN